MISLSTMVRDIRKSLNVPPTIATKGVLRRAGGKALIKVSRNLRCVIFLMDENVPMLDVLTRRMLERSDKARDL
jgi:hypothetical protein